MVGGIGVILWATETTFVNFTIGIPPLQTVALAFLFAASFSPIVWWVTGSHPLLAFRQPLRIWVLTVGSLVGYHSCIYYATQKAPLAAAALLQGTTPLMIVLGSAFLPGEKIRWWHLAGASLGFLGVICLIETGVSETATSFDNVFYLALIGVAAGLWGLYSVITRTLPEVPSSALGLFYFASSIVAFAGHFTLETWVQPTSTEFLAIAGLGVLPMGLAIYFWDFGLKRGDIQALGAFSYVEPFIGALLVALITTATLSMSHFWSGLLVISGAIIASASLWQPGTKTATAQTFKPQCHPILLDLAKIETAGDLERINDRIVRRLIEIGEDHRLAAVHEIELRQLLIALKISVHALDQAPGDQLWNEVGSAQPNTRTTMNAGG